MLSRLFGGAPAPVPGETQSDGLLPVWRNIVVPASGAPFALRSVQTACRLADDQPGATVHLIYLIEVPRALAIQATLPNDEQMAEATLGAAMNITRRFGVTATTSVLRGRDIYDTLTRYTKQQGCDLLVLGARADDLRGLPLSVCREIYLRAECEVLLDYAPEGL